MDARPPWAKARQWRVLQVGFADGARFLSAWRSWLDDPDRPGLLHHVAIVQRAPDASTFASEGDLAPLARQLAQRCTGLTPGFHRFCFEDGRVLLTLCVGELAAMLKEQAFRADAIVCDALLQPTLKALPRLCRTGTLLACEGAVQVTARELGSLGFIVESDAAPGWQARYAPAWQVRGLAQDTQSPPTDCIVVGAGLAGAAVAASLARRGCAVRVLDAATEPAAGASALPAGLLAPHQSPDDNLLSRLSRSGVRATWQECDRLLQLGADWAPSGALEVRGDDLRPLPALGPGLQAWSSEADAARKTAAGLTPRQPAWWHATAAWVRPAALVRAWLAGPGIVFRGQCDADTIGRDGDDWVVRDAHGAELGRAPLVVVAAAGASARLLSGRIATHPVRGQVSWGPRPTGSDLPAHPVNGNGHFLPDVPLNGGRAWLTGSTYGRADADPRPRAHDHTANLERLRDLLPTAATQLAPQFAATAVQAWSNVRWASTDRRPLAGELAPGLWVSTAMGSRGLTFAALCAELIAARLHGEPWPLEARLAQALDARRSLAPPSPSGKEKAP